MIPSLAQRILNLLNHHYIQRSLIDYPKSWVLRRTKSNLLRQHLTIPVRNFHVLRAAGALAIRELEVGTSPEPEVEEARKASEVEEIEGKGEVAVASTSRKKSGVQNWRTSMRSSPHLHLD